MKKLISIVIALMMVLSFVSTLPITAVGIEFGQFKPVSNELTLYRVSRVGYGDYSIALETDVTIEELEASAQSLSQRPYTDYTIQSSENVELYGRSAIAGMADGASLVEAYDRLDRAVRARLESVDLADIGLSVDNTVLVFFAYEYDHTECFWLDNGLRYSYNWAGNVVTVYPKYIFSAEELPSAKTKFDAAVDELLSGVYMNLDEFERAKIIHDRIVLEADYDYAAVGNPDDNKAHSSYGCIVEDECVCEGYAKAFVYLARRVGIQSFIATGYGNGGAHAWNYVKINGEFYHTDLTWDDMGDDSNIPLIYDYYNLTDDEITTLDHTIENEFGWPLPQCNSNEENYYDHYDARVTEYDYDNIVRIAKTSRLVVPGKVIVYYYNGYQGNGVKPVNGIYHDASRIASEIGITAYEGIDLYSTPTAFVLYGNTTAISSAPPDISGYCGGEGDGTNLSWTLDSEGTLTISGNGKMVDSSSESPFSEYSSRIKSAVLNFGVTSIGESAFRDCTGLTSVTIPDSVTSIGDYAFVGCEGLTSITIPNSVTDIGICAFSRCTGLTSITIPDSVTRMGDYVFRYCASLTSITIPNGVTRISYYAFDGCTSLASVTIPNSVTGIACSAFSGCTSLTSVIIPDSVTGIGEYAFSGCTSLTSITIPSSVTFIGEGMFSGCTGLTSVTIPNSITSISVYMFKDCTGLTSITIPDSVTSIGGGAFSRCTGLTSVTIPDSVTSIGGYLFEFCTGLTDIYCEAESKPDGWRDEWCTDCSAKVHWGWKGNTVYGDADGDGEITSIDRVTLSRYLAGWEGYETINEAAADVNKDGKINSQDRVILSRYLAKWEGYETLPYIE